MLPAPVKLFYSRPIPVFLAVLCLFSGGCLSHLADSQAVENRAREEMSKSAQNNGFPEGYNIVPIQEEDLIRHGIFPVRAGQISFDEALQQVAVYNRRCKEAELAWKEAVAQTKEAASGLYPALSFGADVRQERPDDTGTWEDKYSLHATLTQPLWHGGAIIAGINAVSANEAKLKSEYLRIVREVQADIAKCYIRILLDQQLVKVQERAVAVSGRTLATAQSRLKNGVATAYEVRRAEVDLAATKSKMLEARHKLENDLVVFYQLLGVSQHSNLRLSGTIQSVIGQLPEIENPEDVALRNRSELVAAYADLYKAQQNYRVERAKDGLAVDLFGRGEYTSEGGGDWEKEWSIGVTSTYTLSLFERNYRLQAAETRIEAAQAAIDRLEQTILTEVVAAKLALAYARDFAATQEQNFERANELVRIMEAGFTSGKNTQIELLDARDAAVAAAGDSYSAQAEVAVALIDLHFRTGIALR